jgi:hypothetical protein
MLGTRIQIAATLVLVVGCERTPEPAESKPTASSVSPAVPQPHAPTAEPKTAGLVWKDPPNFERLPTSSPMRKATYRVLKAAPDREDAELAVFYFGSGQGGGVEANVQRWVGQFSDVKPGAVHRSDRSANGLQQHLVEIQEGTYRSGMPGGDTTAKLGVALIGAIVEAPNGNWFFKMTGPRKTIEARRAAFLELLDSAKSE